jgi:hypothetical protein
VFGNNKYVTFAKPDFNKYVTFGPRFLFEAFLLLLVEVICSASVKTTRFGLQPLDGLNDATVKEIFEFFEGVSLREILQRDLIVISEFEDAIRTSSQLKTLWA